jgi:hypothetical protein
VSSLKEFDDCRRCAVPPGGLEARVRRQERVEVHARAMSGTSLADAAEAGTRDMAFVPLCAGHKTGNVRLDNEVLLVELHYFMLSSLQKTYSLFHWALTIIGRVGRIFRPGHLLSAHL